MSEPNCNACKFCVPDERYGTHQCRRYAPRQYVVVVPDTSEHIPGFITIPTGYYYNAFWPIVELSDWCGEFINAA